VITLAPMTTADLDVVMPYEVPMFGSEAWSIDSYRDELADKRYRYYLTARGEDGGLLGWAGLHVLDETAQILTIGVVPSAQRRGIATQLMRAMYDEATRRGAHEMFLEVRIDNDAARAMYTREGFESVGMRRRYYDNGRVDGITMRRVLDEKEPA
jgi:ribosomal-protein-alanine N-acetyltransferase